MPALDLTEDELHLIRNVLLARRIYRPYGERWGYSIWHEPMPSLLDKVESLMTPPTPW